MKGVCKVCQCTENNPCFGEGGDENMACHWVLDNLCSACVIELTPEQHGQGDYGLLIEKQCQNCAHLVESKDLPPRFENYWECDAGRISDRLPSGEDVRWPFKRSGFERPNKVVKKAQRHCPDFKVHPCYLKPSGGGSSQ